jgi:hypothetical protein
LPPPRKKLKSPVENQRKITFFLGQTDESNQDSTEDIGTTGNSDNTSDTPVEWPLGRGFVGRLGK